MPAEAQTKVEAQSEAEAKMVDLPSDGPSVDVTVPENSTKTINPDVEQEITQSQEVVKDTASTEEMDDYGKKVQSRIDKLTKKLREAERREQAAIEFAQGVQQKTKDLQTRAKTLDSGYITEFASRVEAETAEAKKALKAAVELGDSDAQVEAQQKLARLAIESERVKSTQAQRERLKKEMEARGVNPNQPQMPNPQQMQPPAAHLHRQIQRQRLGLIKTSGLVKMNL